MSSSNWSMCWTPCRREYFVTSSNCCDQSTPFLFTSSNSLPQRRARMRWPSFSKTLKLCLPQHDWSTNQSLTDLWKKWIHPSWTGRSDDMQAMALLIFRWTTEDTLPGNKNLETKPSGSGSREATMTLSRLRNMSSDILSSLHSSVSRRLK